MLLNTYQYMVWNIVPQLPINHKCTTMYLHYYILTPVGTYTIMYLRQYVLTLWCTYTSNYTYISMYLHYYVFTLVCIYTIMYLH